MVQSRSLAVTIRSMSPEPMMTFLSNVWRRRHADDRDGEQRGCDALSGGDAAGGAKRVARAGGRQLPHGARAGALNTGGKQCAQCADGEQVLRHAGRAAMKQKSERAAG